MRAADSGIHSERGDCWQIGRIIVGTTKPLLEIKSAQGLATVLNKLGVLFLFNRFFF